MATQRVEIYIDGKDGLSKPSQNAAKSLGGLDRAAQNSGNAVRAMGQRSESAGRQLEGFANHASKAGMLLTLAAAPILAAGVAATKMAMDAVESENLFSVSMGEMEGSARAFSERLRSEFGLNAYEARKQIGTWNVMINSMGMSKDASLEMSKGLTQLTYDMASFYNLKPDEAFLKLQSGISGEIEPLRRLGIVINETTVAQWAMSRGLAKSAEDMSEAQKVVARYNIIMEQTSKAQGDLARTIESPANQLRIFRSTLEQTAIEAGQMFLPEMQKALGWLNKEGLPALKVGLDKTKTAWGEMSDEAKTKTIAVAALFVAGGPLLKGISLGVQAVGLLAKAFMLLPASANIGIAAGLSALILFRDQIADIEEAIGGFIRGYGELLIRLNTLEGRESPFRAMAHEAMTVGAGMEEGAKKLREAANVATTLGEGLLKMATTPAIDALVGQIDKLGLTFDTTAYKAIEAAKAYDRGFIMGYQETTTRAADLWGAAAAKMADPAATAKIKQQMKDAAVKSAEAFWKLDEDYAEVMGSLVTKHGNAMLEIGRDEQKATAKFREQIQERTSAYNDGMRELETSHQKTTADIARQEGKHTEEFERQVAVRSANFRQSMGDMQASHAETMADLKAQLADLSADWDKAFRDREADYAQERKEAPDRYVSEKEAAKRKTEEIKKLIEEEQAKGAGADQQLLADLRQRLAEEEAAVRQSYNDYLKALTQRQLQEKEERRKEHEERLAEFRARLAEEDAEYKQKVARAQADYNQDLANYRRSLAEQQAELKRRRADEDAEYETRKVKLKLDFDKDVENYKAALAEQLNEFKLKRQEEATELAVAMDKRKRKYEEDVGEVKKAEAEKLQALRDRLAEEARAKANSASVPGTSAGVNITVPGMASGAIVTKPTLAVIGERYRPEAVIPLDRVYNHSSTVNNFGGGIDYERLAAALAKQPIVLRIDGEDLVVRGYEQARRRGRI